MKSIIVVEDEKLVLLGIESLFEQHGRYHIVGSFSRADQALRALDTLDPDIILTDIKMPGMDGLEFLKRLQEDKVRAKVVVLSCLEDFAIVSTAFKLGAVDYILKHELDAVELFKTLDGLDQGKPEKKQHLESPDHDWTVLHCFSDMLQTNKLFSSGLSSPIVYRMIFKKKYSENHIPLKSGVDIFWCLRFVRRLLNDFQVGQVYYEESEGLVLVLDGSSDSEDARKKFLCQLLVQLKQYINSPVVVLRGTEVTKQSVQEQWQRLSDVQEHVFYIDSTRLALLGIDKQGSLAGELPSPLWLLQSEKQMLWHTAMKTFFTTVKRAKVDPPALCMNLIVYWHQVQQVLKSLYVQPKDAIAVHTTMFEYMKDFDDFNQLAMWYTAELPQRTAYVLDVQGHSRKIMQMKLYVLEHYAEHITLQDMAKQFGFNRNYVSELFKKESGIGFVTYLNTIRINNAKALLLESDATVEVISNQVGYTSASHFSRLFKKMTGKTVSEFRSQCVTNMNMEHEN
ncbi:MAG: response regulator [Sphaerochaeta sp.]|nr:response regulator [Sphaerochaeta sp.]